MNSSDKTLLFAKQTSKQNKQTNNKKEKQNREKENYSK